jgi:hypothetical protein
MEALAARALLQRPVSQEQAELQHHLYFRLWV